MSSVTCGESGGLNGKGQPCGLVVRLPSLRCAHHPFHTTCGENGGSTRTGTKCKNSGKINGRCHQHPLPKHLSGDEINDEVKGVVSSSSSLNHQIGQVIGTAIGASIVEIAGGIMKQLQTAEVKENKAVVIPPTSPPSLPPSSSSSASSSASSVTESKSRSSAASSKTPTEVVARKTVRLIRSQFSPAVVEGVVPGSMQFNLSTLGIHKSHQKITLVDFGGFDDGVLLTIFGAGHSATSGKATMGTFILSQTLKGVSVEYWNRCTMDLVFNHPSDGRRLEMNPTSHITLQFEDIDR